jgi:iron complex transport system permease protein
MQPSVVWRVLLLFLLLLVGITLNLCLGDVFFTPAQAFGALFHNLDPANTPAGLQDIVWQLRFPRLLIAMLVGAALALSGYVLQALSRNQLADPSLTGVSRSSLRGGSVCGVRRGSGRQHHRRAYVTQS